MTTVSTTPLFDTCDDNSNSHYTESAWGFTWCECDHTAIVEQHDPTHDCIDPDSLPVWWNRALREALDATEDSGFDLEIAWAHLRELAHDLAADGTWERWDEFGPHVIGLDPGPAEEFLRLLDAAGIADVVVSSWEHRDGKDTWHGGDCGCIQISLSLNAARWETTR